MVEESLLGGTQRFETNRVRPVHRRTICTLLCFCVITISAKAQVVPAADHHAHLQSPKAARLLNEAAHLHPEDASQEKAQEKERALTAKKLVRALDAAGIQKATALSEAYLLGTDLVHVANEAEVVDAENDWTLRQVAPYPNRLVGFCSVNPIKPYALAALQHCVRIGLRGGLKLHLAASHFDFRNPDEVHELQEVFREANRLRMPILIHLHPYDDKWDGGRDTNIFIEQVLPLAPDIPVQVAHLAGWGGYDRSADAALATFAEKCAPPATVCNRLYFDISAVIVPPSAATAPKGSDLRFIYDNQKDFPEGPQRLAANLRRIGLDRILFATDWPVLKPDEYIKLLRTGLPLNPGEIDQIFHNVAPYFPTH